jgi:hypothetical protein
MTMVPLIDNSADPNNCNTLHEHTSSLCYSARSEKGAEMKRHIYGFVCLWLLIVLCQTAAWSQQAPSELPPASVTGKWTLYCNDPNGSTSTKYLDLQQEGTTIKGHFKGPNQSGGVEGTINEQHLVVRTKTRDVLVFRGRINGSRVNGVVQGNTFNGTFHDRGGTGTFQGMRTQ